MQQLTIFQITDRDEDYADRIASKLYNDGFEPGDSDEKAISIIDRTVGANLLTRIFNNYKDRIKDRVDQIYINHGPPQE